MHICRLLFRASDDVILLELLVWSFSAYRPACCWAPVRRVYCQDVGDKHQTWDTVTGNTTVFPAALLPSPCSSHVAYILFKAEKKPVCKKAESTGWKLCFSSLHSPKGKCKPEEVTGDAGKARSQRGASGWAVGVFTRPDELAQCSLRPPSSAEKLCTSGHMKLRCKPALVVTEVAQPELAPVLCIEPNFTAWTSSVFPLQGLVLLD